MGQPALDPQAAGVVDVPDVACPMPPGMSRGCPICGPKSVVAIADMFSPHDDFTGNACLSCQVIGGVSVIVEHRDC